VAMLNGKIPTDWNLQCEARWNAAVNDAVKNLLPLPSDAMKQESARCFTTIVYPTIRLADKQDSLLLQAFVQYREWSDRSAKLGIDVKGDEARSMYHLEIGFKNAVLSCADRCVLNSDPAEANHALFFAQEAQRLGFDSVGKLAWDLIPRCVRFDINVTSIIGVDSGGTGWDSTEYRSASFQVWADPADVYRIHGSGTLKLTNFTWYANHIPNHGSGLSVVQAYPMVVEVPELYLDLSVLKTDTSRKPLPPGMAFRTIDDPIVLLGVAGSPGGIGFANFGVEFARLHKDELIQGNLLMPDRVFVFPGFTAGTGVVVGTREYSQVVPPWYSGGPSLTELTTIEIVHHASKVVVP
jgi:hypothetical protein